VLEEANRRWRAALAAPFNQSKGDAFQVLFAEAWRFPEALIGLEARLRGEGLTARYGVGLGRVEGLSGGEAPSPALLTGEAFPRAEEALARARSASRLAAALGENPAWNGATEAALTLLDHLAQRWPPTVWRRLPLFLEASNLEAVARAEGVSYQAVHKESRPGRAGGAERAFRAGRRAEGGRMKALGWILLWLLAVPGGSPFVRWVLRQVPAIRPKPGLEAAGRWIGYLERALVLALLRSGNPAGVGFVFASQAIAGFP